MLNLIYCEKIDVVSPDKHSYEIRETLGEWEDQSILGGVQ